MASEPMDVDTAPVNAMPRITRDEFREHETYKAYRDYLSHASDARDPQLENFYQLCCHFGYIPSLELITWIAEESTLVDSAHRLEYPVYAFLQEYKFALCVGGPTEQPRMRVGWLVHYRGKVELWAGWSAASGTTGRPKMRMYYCALARDGDVGQIELLPELRKYIQWEEGLERIFKLSQYEAKPADVRIQNATLLSVAKVVARFPGLLLAPPGREDAAPIQRLRRIFADRPFDVREEPSIYNPFWDGFEVLVSGLDMHSGTHKNYPPHVPDYAESMAELKRVKEERAKEKKAKRKEAEGKKAEEKKSKLHQFRMADDKYRELSETKTGRPQSPLAHRILQNEPDASGLDHYQKQALEHGETSWDTLDWIVEEAKLGHRVVPVLALNIPCFYFMQNNPWFMRQLNKGVRLFIGHFKSYLGLCEVWVGWEPSETADMPPEMKFYGDCDDDHENIVLQITPDLRQYMQWHPSFEAVFRFTLMCKDNAQNAAIRQDAHLRAIAKVLARFPGLVMERHPDDDKKVVQANGRSWDKFPFDIREANKPENPYKDFTRMLDSGNIDITEYEKATGRGAEVEVEPWQCQTSSDDEEDGGDDEEDDDEDDERDDDEDDGENDD